LCEQIDLHGSCRQAFTSLVDLFNRQRAVIKGTKDDEVRSRRHARSRRRRMSHLAECGMCLDAPQIVVPPQHLACEVERVGVGI
jgi:hypothetical protein